MKRLLLRIQFFIILLLFIPPSRSNAFWVNLPADYIITDNVFEYIEDCLGQEKFREILNEEKGRTLYISYDLNGNLKSVGSGIIFDNIQKAYFLEEEWENIFDYFDNLPPLPFSNPVEYLFDEKKYYDLNIEKTINRIIDADGYTFRCDWTFGEGGSTCSKDEQFYDWYKKNLYSYDFNKRNENPDLLFGKVHWYELSGRYYDKYNSEYLKSTQPEYEHFKQPGFYWAKIPIKNYTVNLQIPINSKITIAPDTLSATINFPHLAHVFIQYTKGLPDTRLWYGECNPRKREIGELYVNRKYLVANGRIEIDGIWYNWIRIRYRYGITITIYSKIVTYYDDYDYYKTVILPATIVLRPKFKTIYLND